MNSGTNEHKQQSTSSIESQSRLCCFFVRRYAHTPVIENSGSHADVEVQFGIQESLPRWKKLRSPGISAGNIMPRASSKYRFVAEKNHI